MLRFFAIAAAVLISLSASRAEVAREVSWDDLLPQLPPIVDPLSGLPTDQRYELSFIANVRMLKRLDRVDDDNPALGQAAEFAIKWERQGVDVDGLIAKFDVYLAEIERRDATLNEALDGASVRLPGYLLPLEFDGTAVSEFLLVPYVGACIHAPPPPPNQIVHVTLDGSYSVSELYDAVWVTGRMRAEHSSRALSYVDGQADVAVGYTLSAKAVEPYKN